MPGALGSARAVTHQGALLSVRNKCTTVATRFWAQLVGPKPCAVCVVAGWHGRCVCAWWWWWASAERGRDTGRIRGPSVLHRLTCTPCAAPLADHRPACRREQARGGRTPLSLCSGGKLLPTLNVSGVHRGAGAASRRTARQPGHLGLDVQGCLAWPCFDGFSARTFFHAVGARARGTHRQASRVQRRAAPGRPATNAHGDG